MTPDEGPSGAAGRTEAERLIARYPLARSVAPETLAAEIATLDRLEREPGPKRLFGHLRLTGPGFMGAALTLGAGTLTSAMLMGASFGYRTLWIVWLSVALGLFMMAASARFACVGEFRVIPTLKRRHGILVGAVLTGIVGCAFVGVVFSFGQYSLATHLVESIAVLHGFEFPRSWNWVLIVILTSWLTLMYGRKDAPGVARIEWFMKASILLMLLGFGASLLVVGVNWNDLARGMFVPWLPRGVEGITLFIASSTAAIGVMDWVFFHYTSLSRGWGPRHERLARFDMVVGFFLPFVLVNFMVVAVFAQTLYGQPNQPETAPDLARSLEPLLGGYWSQVLFYLGFLAVPITTIVGMSIVTAMAIHEAFGWTPDTSSLRWKVTALLPQIGFLGVWHPRPLWLVVMIGAFLSLSQNFVGWSYYLLMNDREVLGERRCRSVWWNAGMLLDITLINCVSVVYALSQLKLWPE